MTSPALRRQLPLLLVAACVGGLLVWLFVGVPGGTSRNDPTGASPASSTATPKSGGGSTAVVERVVDGDTIVVDLDGERTRVRLLNVDTPETVAEDRPVECMGPEASAFTKELLPEGTEVSLEYDVVRTDPYDRTLAAVFTPNGRNVSVELARRGLGKAVSYGDNVKYLAEVQEAMAEARHDHEGLFSATLDCAS
jgi:micrococcal nuclease